MADPLDLRAAADETEAAARGLARLAANRGRVYYDAEADAAARNAYYAAVDLRVGPAEVFTGLSALLETTHQPRLSYRPSEELYPWIDLHPDGLLHHIYSGRPVEPAHVIKEDAEISRRRAERLRQVVESNPALGPAERIAASHAIGHELRFNCEHVVPQGWFSHREPMRGDLHHLFACEPHCNTVRGSTPYADLADTRQRLADCGRSTDLGFEPHEGKGAVARATLYFLLRYPGQIGDEMGELQKAAISTLLEWDLQHRVTEYERHRNAAISEAQGNRNPFIDLDGLAEQIDLGTGFHGR